MARTFYVLVDNKDLGSKPMVFNANAEATSMQTRVAKKSANRTTSDYQVVTITV